MLTFLKSTSVLESLLISLHGPDALAHEAFVGVPGSFNETVHAIRRAAETGLKVATSIVITRYNWNRVEEMVAFVRSLGGDHTVFNRYIGQPLPGLEATSTQMVQAVQRVEALIAAGEPVRWGTPVPFCISPRAISGCLAGEAFVTVDPWGNVRPCNHAPYVIGNLLDQSFEKIWYSPAMEAWRVMSPAECAGCILFENCRGGCRAEAMLRSASSYPLPRNPSWTAGPFEVKEPHLLHVTVEQYE